MAQIQGKQRGLSPGDPSSYPRFRSKILGRAFSPRRLFAGSQVERFMARTALQSAGDNSSRGGVVALLKKRSFFKKMVKNRHVFAAAASDLHHVTELGSFIPLRSHFSAMPELPVLSRNEPVLRRIPHSYILIFRIFIKNGAQSMEGKKNKG